jgi:hypothetical protein
MITVNPESAHKGKYNPINRVTAIYGTRDALHTIIQSLGQAGFEEQEIDVFIGEEGAETLDLNGKKLGAVVRFARYLEMALSDETETHKQLDEALRNGGMSINVFVRGEDEKKMRAARILKAHNPQDIRYWGQLSIERL